MTLVYELDWHKGYLQKSEETKLQYKENLEVNLLNKFGSTFVHVYMLIWIIKRKKKNEYACKIKLYFNGIKRVRLLLNKLI